MSKKIVVLLFIVIGILQSCNTTEPPLTEKTITLTLEDAASIEAWIKLTTTNLQLPATVNLKQSASGGVTVTQDIILSYADTVIYIDSLLPNTTYSFLAAIQPSNHTNEVKSNVLTVTTMDTTSHNFTWQTWTFGEHSSSVLYDVAIIDPDNIWAVGEIYMNDSLGNPDPTFYNAAHWDGQKWELKRIFYKGGIWTIRTIFAFNENDIWFSAFVRYDGENFIELPIPNILIGWSINKLWGTSSNDLYIVGNNGNIAWYNGSRWTRIESGTDVNVNDVFGVTGQFNNQKKIFCAISNVFEVSDHKILTIDDNNKVDSLHWNTGRRVNSVWSNNGWVVYTSGGGVFNNKSGAWIEEKSIPLYYTNRIRGNALNDILVGGDFGLLAHFNGKSWNVYEEFLYAVSSLSVSVNSDIVSAVGRSGGKALIIIGKRN
ncbi:MAG: glucosyl transferase [Bacteroidetes bacterium]|nr:glucosyl transferase [Bacteroidota bacterium]